VLEIPDVHEKRIEAFPQHLLLLTLTEDNVADRIEVAERISSETSPFAGDQCDRIENCDKVKLQYCPDFFP
jgi:hypothetical protein